MRLAHLNTAPDSAPELVVVRGDRFTRVADLGFPFTTLQDLITAAPEVASEFRSSVDALSDDSGMPLDGAVFAPAVIAPPIVLAVGLNYDEHASELHLDNDSGPVLFSLFPNSLGAHGADVTIPLHLSEEVDYEGELAVVIGRAAKNVSPEDALDYVFGYTAVNDLTARNIQFQEPQWSRCKSFDGFTPIGPVVVTADEIPDPQALKLTTDVDGVRVQDSTTGFMIRSVAQLISSISQATTILPGTVISTGSPGGAGRSRKPPLYMLPGMNITVTIEGIGALDSHCV